MCERCGRQVERGAIWRLTASVPPDTRIERDICVVCAAELRRFLLHDARRLEPAPPPPGNGASDGVALSLRSRVNRALLRWAVYLGVALSIFLLATWLLSR